MKGVEKQRLEIENEIDSVSQGLQERMNKMNDQLNLLDILRKEKNDYKRELERLHYKVKDLNKHIDKY
jgi:uncharacterized coiled-coil DUF342 family protein